MATHDKRGGGVYVYNMAAELAPRPSAVSKGWGSFVRSKTYRERSEREKKAPVAEQPRRSVSGVENVGSVAALLQVKVLVTDMPEFMQVHAFRCARTTYDGLHKFSSKYMAYNIKKEFDKVYGAAWHCIVGFSGHLSRIPPEAFSISPWRRYTFWYSRPKLKEHYFINFKM